MKWCPRCDNMMVPKKNKLICSACKYELDITEKDKMNYKLSKTIHKDNSKNSPIIIRYAMNSEKISSEDRKAHDDFFRTLS